MPLMPTASEIAYMKTMRQVCAHDKITHLSVMPLRSVDCYNKEIINR